MYTYIFYSVLLHTLRICFEKYVTRSTLLVIVCVCCLCIHGICSGGNGNFENMYDLSLWINWNMEIHVHSTLAMLEVGRKERQPRQTRCIHRKVN